jgi:hypothetical protein
MTIPSTPVGIWKFFGLKIEWKFFMNTSQEFLRREFIHLLGETLILLGAEKRLVEDIKATEEKPLSHAVIDKIRKFNREQSVKARDAAALLNTTFSYRGN